MLNRLSDFREFVCRNTGDGGGGGGTNPGEGGGEGDQLPEGMTEDTIKFLDQKIHSALGVHLTRFRSSFEKDLDKKLEGQFTPLNEQLGGISEFIQGFKEQGGGKGGTPGNGAPGGGNGAPPIPQEWEARFSDMQKKYEGRVAELEQKNRDEAQAREQERNERLQSEERHALGTALANAGIEGPRARAAMALLYNEDKRVSRDDEGNIIFLVPKAGYTDQVTLDEGVGDWLKTDDGKAFLPPRGAGGSGGRASGHPRGGKPPSKAEKQQQAKVQLAEIMGVLPQGSSEGV